MSAGVQDRADAMPAVLVVEDETIIRHLLVAEFEDANFLVHEADSADEAIRLLKGGITVVAVVTDLRMPGRVDGSYLVEWLQDNRTGTPVIVTSGHAALSDFAKNGSTNLRIVSKPYKPHDLIALVFDALAQAP